MDGNRIPTLHQQSAKQIQKPQKTIKMINPVKASIIINKENISVWERINLNQTYFNILSIDELNDTYLKLDIELESHAIGVILSDVFWEGKRSGIDAIDKIYSTKY